MANKVFSYKDFDPDTDIIITERNAVTGLMLDSSSLSGSLMGIETSSTSTTYFVQLTGSNSSEGAFDIATVCWGFSGSGGNYTSESLTLYRQFTQFFVGREGTGSADFEFHPTAGASKSDAGGFMAVYLNRERFQDQLQPGTWHIKFRPQDVADTGLHSYTDGAATSSNPIVKYGNRGRWDYLYSGTRKVGSTLGIAASGEQVGMVFYDYGVIIMNSAVTYSGWTGSSDTNPGGYSQLSGSYTFATKIEEIAGFGTAKLKSTLYFSRLGNREFNFSQNPTFYNPSTGVILNASIKNDPVTFITSIGLYNAKSELLAVGKIEVAQEKSFTKEIIINSRIDY